MKKSIKFLFAAIAILTVASCAKEELLAPSGDAELRTVTVSLSDTKTSLNETNNVVWTAGDSLWISNGTEVSSWIVPAEAEGQKSFTFTTALSGDLYVVYPATAAKGVSAGKLTVVVPGAQDGSFSTANICVGKADAEYKVNLHNATAVAKIAVDDAAANVKTLSLSSTAPLAGDCEVTFTGTGIAVAAGESTFGGISVQDASGELYVAVIPGTYPAGFQFSAISTDLQTETKTTTVANTLKANDIVNLGTIGTNMTGLTGEGTEGAPYLIKNLAEWLALAYYVNDAPENTMEGKFIKVENDIDGISACVGGLVNDGEKDIDYYFKGNLDGNNKTLKVNFTGTKAVALFGDVTAPAIFKNVKVAGTSTASGNYAAGIAAMVNGGEGVSFTDCESSVSVTGAQYVGGITGYTDGIVSFTNCTNNGKLTANGHWTGGIAAIATNGTFNNCTNNGIIESNAGQCVAGICGKILGFSTFAECDNTGSITTNNCYVGGILGYSNITDGADGKVPTITKCNNSGTITPGYYLQWSSSNPTAYMPRSYTGGIVGYYHVTKLTTNTLSVIDECTNTGTIDASKAGGWVGGIVGEIQDDKNQQVIIVNKCTNSGEIKGIEKAYEQIDSKNVAVYYLGGIAGYPGRTTVQSCTNESKISGPAVEYVAGISATNRNSAALDCVNNGAITGNNYVAGITGYQNWSSVTRCTNKGNVTGIKSVGGIVGQASDVCNEYSSCNEGDILGDSMVGGIIGYYTSRNNRIGSMHNCYNTGSVKYINSESTNPYVGGIIGRHVYGKIYNVYNTGTVGCAGGEVSETAKAASVGGIAGTIAAGNEFNYCYYLESSFGQICGGTNPYPDNRIYAVKADGIFKDGAEVTFEATKKGDLTSSKVSETLQNWIVSKNAAYLVWEFKDDTTPAFGEMYTPL